ncbi:hypothetical protein, partial [Herbiconiux daphne]
MGTYKIKQYFKEHEAIQAHQRLLVNDEFFIFYGHHPSEQSYWLRIKANVDYTDQQDLVNEVIDIIKKDADKVGKDLEFQYYWEET